MIEEKDKVDNKLFKIAPINTSGQINVKINRDQIKNKYSDRNGV